MFKFLILLIISFNIWSKYEITVLATNISNYGGFGEWSFSALYESDDESILFDTGFHEDTVLHNAQVLNKDLSKVEKVVLSHYHSDNTGGLIKRRKTCKSVSKQAINKDYGTRGLIDQENTKDGTKISRGKLEKATEYR